MLKFRQKAEHNPVAIPELALKSQNTILTADSSYRSDRSGTVSGPHGPSSFCKKNQGKQCQQRKVNEIIPGIKFGRFFGTIEEATERQVKRRISERTGTLPSELQVVTQTVRGLSRGRDLSVSQKILLGKIEQVEKQIKKLGDLNPKIKKQNDQLREHNRSLRVQSETMRKRAQKWQKYNKIKQEQLQENMQNHYIFTTKMIKIHNQCTTARNNQIRVSRIQ